MRVVIDARSIHPKLQGVGRHVLNLLIGLSYQNSDIEFLVLYSSPLARKLVERSGGSFRGRFHWIKSWSRHGGNWSGWFENAEIPWLLKTHRAKLFHDVGTSGAWTFGVPSVTTVHQLAALHFPEMAESSFKPELKRVLKRTKLIIAVSDSLANEIEDQFSISRPKIRVISNAVDPWLQTKASEIEIRAMREHFKLGEKYFLCVTADKPNKNIGLAQKMAEVWKGEEQWVFTTPEHSRPSKSDRASLRFLGLVEDAWMRPLYAACTAVVVPSFYEGFSLPPVEALATGSIPVVSDIAPHREILGEVLPNELFFSPNDTSALDKALRAVIDGGELLKTSILEKFFLVRDRYSFIETARQVQAVYREAIK